MYVCSHLTPKKERRCTISFLFLPDFGKVSRKKEEKNLEKAKIRRQNRKMQKQGEKLGEKE